MIEILEKLFYGKDSYYSNYDELKFKNEFRFMPQFKNFEEYRGNTIERNGPSGLKYIELINEQKPYIFFKPYTLKEFENLTFPTKHVVFDLIDPKFYNKKFKVGDYTIHLQYKKDFNPVNISEATDEWKKDKNYKYIQDSQYTYENWCIILEFHGVFKILGHARIYERVSIEYINNARFGYWNYAKLKAEDFDDDQRLLLSEHNRELTYSNFNNLLFDLFKECPSDIELSDCEIEYQDYYDWNTKKKLEKYFNPDFEWFIKQGLKKGIYSPDSATIKYVFGISNKKPNKDLLNKLGVNTIQLSAKDHFDIAKYFNMDGITIKGPKSVITKYGYEKYLNNEKMLNTIKKDKEEQERKDNLAKYNDTFTLMFHGKEIMVDCSSNKIIEYLQNKSTKDTEQLILDSFKVIFDTFKEIDKFELCSFGTYYAYELAGEFHYSCEKENNHISEDILGQIEELYSDKLIYPSEEYLELAYGRIERGAILVGVRRNGNNLEIYTEDYDLC